MREIKKIVTEVEPVSIELSGETLYLNSMKVHVQNGDPITIPKNIYDILMENLKVESLKGKTITLRSKSDPCPSDVFCIEEIGVDDVWTSIHLSVVLLLIEM